MSWFLPLDIGLVMGLIFAWPVVAFATTFRLVAFPDLTIEGSFPLGAAVSAVALSRGYSLPIAMTGALAAGAALGVFTALIHTKLGVNKFLAGIIVVAMSYTLCLRIMQSANIGLINFASYFDFTSGLDTGLGAELQLGTLTTLAVLLLVGTVLILIAIRTRTGTRVRVAGSNPQYARAIGVSVAGSIVTALALSNAIVAASGALLASYQGFADVGMGQGILILALASMTIGERLLPERTLSIPSFVVLSAIAGSIVYQLLIAYAVRIGLEPTDLKLATSMFVLAVIALRIRKKDDAFLEAIR